MTFIVATYVIASQPPERRPTGTPHARANIQIHTRYFHLEYLFIHETFLKKKSGLGSNVLV